MEESLLVLGTGNALAVNCYNTCFALRTTAGVFLTDTGGGNTILSRIPKAGIGWDELTGLFLTHEHCDHVLGAVWIIRKIATMIRAGTYSGVFPIYCHEKLGEAVQQICRLTLQKKFTNLFGTAIPFIPITDGDRHTVGDLDLTFFDIHSTKALQYGFRCTLPSGTVVCCLGDEPYNPLCRSYVQGCDWLLCEAFCLYEDAPRFGPYEKHHSTVREACQLAQELKIPHTVLWHTEDSDIPHRRQRYTKEGRTFYSGDLHVPEDLEIIPLSEKK